MSQCIVLKCEATDKAMSATLAMRGGLLRSLAAWSVAGRTVAAPVSQQVTSFVTQGSSFNASVNQENKLAKNVSRGFAAEAEPVSAAGKGAITQVGFCPSFLCEEGGGHALWGSLEEERILRARSKESELRTRKKKELKKNSLSLLNACSYEKKRKEVSLE